MSAKVKILLLGIILSFCLMTIFTGKIQAAKNEYGFDDALRYDVYFSGKGSGVSVVHNAAIKELRDIGGKTFLIIQSQGFKLSEADGFLLMDSVLAILPADVFNVRISNEIRVK